MDDNITSVTVDDEIHYCAAHPERDTELRCNRCDRYMCVDCAKRTPVGYTCNECVRNHADKFYQGTLLDYGIVAAVGLVGGAITAGATLLLGGFLIVGFIISPAIGGTAAQIALQLTGRRRGRQSGVICAGGVLAGGIAGGYLLIGALGLFSLLYLALAASAAFARFKMSI